MDLTPTMIVALILSGLVGNHLGWWRGFLKGYAQGTKFQASLQQQELDTSREAGRVQGVEEGRKIGFKQGRQVEHKTMIEMLIKFMEDGIIILKGQQEEGQKDKPVEEITFLEEVYAVDADED